MSQVTLTTTEFVKRLRNSYKYIEETVNNNYKIGLGFDIHRLSENRKLIIGGVEIPYEKGLLGHSDADVLTHAIIDAILGAAGLPDIGTCFPDDNKNYKNINSLLLLKQVIEKVSELNYEIVNIDTNIIAQAPKMAPFIPQMKQQLSETILIAEDRISIKAKTMEMLDAVGRGDGISAQAIVLLTKKVH